MFQVKAGDNLGWRLYEGTIPYNGSYSPGGVTSVTSVTITPPILEYNHSGPFNSITGGYLYRGNADPCLSLKYLYADLYGRYYAGTESNPGSSSWVSKAINNISCASTSPLNCTTPFSESYVYSWAQDANHELYLLQTSGIYRLVAGSKCGYTCGANAPVSSPKSAPSVIGSTIPSANSNAPPIVAPSTSGGRHTVVGCNQLLSLLFCAAYLLFV